MSQVLLTCWGSYGDLHPYLAIGLGLGARGHTVTIATQDSFRTKVEGEGLRFRPLRPDPIALLDDPQAVRRAYDLRTGSLYIVREVVLPHLEAMFEDLSAAAVDADLIVGHPLTYPVSMVAERRGIPWLSTVLQPLTLFSTSDPPLIPAAPWLLPLRRLGRAPYAALMRLAELRLRSMAAPVAALRTRLGLPAMPGNPITGGFSPHGTLACFSPLLAPPQPDWPPHTVATGFPFYDKRDPDDGDDPALTAFLDAGSPPIVFTLGSSAVLLAGRFYQESLEAASGLEQRAVLLVGPDAANRPAGPVPGSIFITEYARYSTLFPRAAVVVHQGGIGTLAQTLAAGVPMLVVPYSHDQPDNARRTATLGCARVLTRDGYRADRAARELRPLLEDPRYLANARDVRAALLKEDGVAAAVAAIERTLARGSGGSAGPGS